jgi:hypothetical protein
MLERIVYACAAILAATWMLNLASRLLLEALPVLFVVGIVGMIGAGVVVFYRNRW